MIGTCRNLGRAPCTKETLPDFHEWCRITRHPRIFRGLTGCQRDTPGSGRHTYYYFFFGLCSVFDLDERYGRFNTTAWFSTVVNVMIDVVWRNQ